MAVCINTKKELERKMEKDKNEYVTYVGHARTDITPPLGVSMAGYAFRKDAGCTDIEDRLSADACCITQDSLRLVWLTLDLCAVEEVWSEPLRQRIAEELDIPYDHIVISASHTHFGPATVKPVNDAHRDWLKQLNDNLLRIAVEAADNAQPATISTDVSDINRIAFNRRPLRADGTCCTTYTLPPPEEGLQFRPIDPQQTLIRFDDADGRPILLLVSTPMHAVVGGKDAFAISADYPGALREALQRVYNVPVMFAAGTAGNVVPFKRGEGMRQVIGNYLAGAAMQAAELCTRCDGRLGIMRQRFLVPTAERLSEDVMSRREQEARRYLDECKLGGDAWLIARAQQAWERAAALLRAAQRLGPGNNRPFDITVIGYGDLGIVFLPGEIFAETGLYIKSRSPFPVTLVVSLTNQQTGYLATRNAIWEGGYEAVSTPYGIESEGFVTDNVIGLLLQVWEKTR
jgi:neutral ceramidase